MWPFRKHEISGASKDWFIAFEDLLTANRTESGVSVTSANCIDHPAVYRCVDLNAHTIGSFPVDFYIKRDGRRQPYPEPLWYRKPNDYQDFNGLLAEAQASQEIYDSAFLLKAVDPSGRIVGLSVLDPGAVEMKYADLGMGKPIVIYNLATTKGIVTLAYNEILHIKAGLPIPGALRGVSPVKAARETIGTGMAARKFGARYFGAGSHVSGMIEAPGAFSKDTADRLKESMEKKHGGVSKSHALGILFGGAKWIPVEHDPTKAQGLETQKYTDIQISSLFGIPAEYVTAAMEGAKGYVTGLYQRQMLWYQTGLFARITRNERAFSSLLPRPAYMKLNVSSWLRMDPEQRVAFYQAGQLGEWLTVNDIRNLEDMNPLPGGDVPLHSVQWQENTPPDPPA